MEAIVVAARVSLGCSAAELQLTAAEDGAALPPAVVDDDAALVCDEALASLNLAISSLNSFSGSLMSAVISCCAWRIYSAIPLMRTVRSPWPSPCFSISMWAPEISRIAFMLHPALPITRLMAFDGTVTFLDRSEL